MSENNHLNVIPAHNEKFRQMEKAIDSIQAFNHEILKVTSEQTNSLDEIHRKLDAWGKQTEAIIELGQSVRNMAGEFKKVQETIDKQVSISQEQHIRIGDIEKKKYEEKFTDLETRVEVIENKAGNTALKYLDRVFTYVLIGATGIALLAIGYYIKFKLGG